MPLLIEELLEEIVEWVSHAEPILPTGASRGSGVTSSNVHRFRRAVTADLDALLELEGRCFERPWPAGAFEQELAAPYSEVWLAFDRDPDGAPIGYVDFHVIADEVSLLNVAVEPAARGRGLGAELVELMERRGRELGGQTVFLEVRRGNTRGLALYRKAGFEQIGLRKGYYSGDREDAVVLCKRLEEAPCPT